MRQEVETTKGKAVRFAFWDELYLYDLNQIESVPMAYRCAAAGQELPDLIGLLGISVREWMQLQPTLYDAPLCLHGNGGALVLPILGSLGRFALVVKPLLTPGTFAFLAQNQYFNGAYVTPQLAAAACPIPKNEQLAAQELVQSVALARLFLESCERAQTVEGMQDCIALAAQMLGVELMPRETAEFLARKHQHALPEMRFSGQALALTLLTLLSFVRNQAHARSGWIYAVQHDADAFVQAHLRFDADQDTQSLTHLRNVLEQGGAVLGTHTFASAVKPPRQYAYMQRKITDPKHPFCARCACLDARCKACTVTEWAVMPCVCDAALLGIKNYFVFSE